MKKLLIILAVFLSGCLFAQTESRTTIKTYFETGKKPTQAQFGKLIDGCANLNDTNAFVSVQTFADTIVLKSGDSLWKLEIVGDTIILNSIKLVVKDSVWERATTDTLTINSYNQTDAIITKRVVIPADSMLVLFTRPQELLPAAGANKFYDIISLSVRLDFNSFAYSVGTDELLIESASSNYYTLPNTFIESASSIFSKAIYAGVNNIPINQQVYITTSTTDPTTGDSDLYFYITYIVRSL